MTVNKGKDALRNSEFYYKCKACDFERIIKAKDSKEIKQLINNELVMHSKIHNNNVTHIWRLCQN